MAFWPNFERKKLPLVLVTKLGQQLFCFDLAILSV